MAKKDRSQKKQDRAALETHRPQKLLGWLTSGKNTCCGMTPMRMHRLLTDAEQGNLQAQADLF
jgi:phage gp29-like protein